ncbi:MAG: helix-turn-helix domain-containing protein [Candidatus Omnitrophica bacterium]|nr:helix-turn-helix domain-containing protein [Candidatus Omnitrophota bacterium]MBU4589604.1 helix-turn-helix domain-containing protein [Candidatus Omnitrophota bacterium]
MREVQEYIDEKLKRDPEFRERYNLILQKLEIAKKIIDYRIKHGLTQKELADELDVTQQYISKIEEGDYSTLDAVGHILFKIGYRLVLRVESNKAKSELIRTPKEWKKIEKIIAEKGKIYRTSKRAKRHIKNL